MTLLDIRNQIVSILCQKNSFAEADFSKVHVAKEDASIKKGLIGAALEELVNMGLVKKIVAESPEGNFDVATSVWVLSSPLNAQGQQVGVSMHLSNAIASVVNSFRADLGDDEEDQVDPLNLHEGDIAALLEIAYFWEDVANEAGESPSKDDK